MIHNITKAQYVSDPCGVSSVAFWKNEVICSSFEVLHESQINHNSEAYERYFRLIHHLRDIEKAALPDGYSFRNVDIANERALVAETINRCYDDISVTYADVVNWTNNRVFRPDLWVFIYDMLHSRHAALGIADFDIEVSEGSLEWIQVLPEYRGRGLGGFLVNEILTRLSNIASFTTVSGRVDNKTKPEHLYRSCGFTGEDIWCVPKDR